MKQRLKTTLLATLVGASIFGMTSGAQAARDGCMMDGPRAMQRQMKPEQLRQRALLNAEYRLARLELALQIDNHQRTAWSSFRTAMLQRARLRFEQREARQNASIARTAIERLQRKEEALKQDAEHLAHTRNAVETLFRQLNEAQKTVFNDRFSLDGGIKSQRMARSECAYGDGWRAGARTLNPGVPRAVGVAPDVTTAAVHPGIPSAVGVAPGVAAAVNPGIPPAVGVVPGVAVAAVNPGIPPAVGVAPGVAVAAVNPGIPPAVGVAPGVAAAAHPGIPPAVGMAPGVAAAAHPGIPPAVGVAPGVAAAVHPGIPPAVGVAPGVAAAAHPGIPPAVGVAPGVAVAAHPGIPPAVGVAPGVAPRYPGLPPAIMQHNAGVLLNEHGLPQEDAMPAVGGENANQPPSR